MVTKAGKIGREVFVLYLGGGMGRNPKLAQLVAGKLPPDKAIAKIKRHLTKLP